MPIKVKTLTTGGKVYTRPFIGAVNHTAQIAVNIAALTTAEVDAFGYLKPGVPLQASGALVSGAGQVVFGVTLEPIPVADGNSNAQLTAAGVQQVAIGTIGQVNRGLIEDTLGRTLTANELSAFNAAGCLVKLLA